MEGSREGRVMIIEADSKRLDSAIALLMHK